jgi:hypothetical protein
MTAQNKKIFLLTVLAIMIYKITKGKKIMSTKFIKFKPDEADKLQTLEAALIKNGLKLPQLNFALAQLLLETGRFTSKSKVSTLNNNYTGIKFLNKPYQIAEKGTEAPPNESKGLAINSPLRYYAKFKDANGWAKDYIRILSFGSKPIQAITIEDFNKRLKANKYYGSTPEAYEKLLKSFLAMFN